MADLDDFLGGKAEAKAETPEPKAEPTIEPKVEAKPEGEPKPRDEAGKFKKGDEVAEPPAAKSKDKPEAFNAEMEPLDPKAKAYYANAKAERQKRQEAERRAAEYERQLQALQTPKKTPDVLEDPEGYKQHISKDVEAQLENQRVNMSAAMARKAHADFDDVMAEWPDLMQSDPSIYGKAAKQELPAEWAYQYVKRERLNREIGEDPDAWRKAEREKIRAELEPELKKQLESSTPTHPTPPQSLASASSGGRISSEPAYEPQSFQKLFRR